MLRRARKPAPPCEPSLPLRSKKIELVVCTLAQPAPLFPRYVQRTFDNYPCLELLTLPPCVRTPMAFAHILQRGPRPGLETTARLSFLQFLQPSRIGLGNFRSF